MSALAIKISPLLLYNLTSLIISRPSARTPFIKISKSSELMVPVRFSSKSGELTFKSNPTSL